MILSMLVDLVSDMLVELIPLRTELILLSSIMITSIEQFPLYKHWTVDVHLTYISS